MHWKHFSPLLLFAHGIAGDRGDVEIQNGGGGSFPENINLPFDFSSSTTAIRRSASEIPSSTLNSSANVVTKSVGSSVTFSFHIPSTGSSDLVMQISAPVSMSWVGLGQGSRMSNANMFIMYANAAGTNITISPRLGESNSEPTVVGSSSLTLLSGSGVSSGFMKANILCTNCKSWSGGSMSYTSTSVSFIWGYKIGSAIASDSKRAHLTQHDDYGTLSVNLVSATGDSQSNPSGANTINTAQSSSTSTSDISTDSDSGGKGGVNPGFHGSLGVIAFVVIFPLGAIVLRVLTFKYVLYTHIVLQLFSYALAIAALITGIILANAESRLTDSHPIAGIIVIAALVVQPILGFAHHALFKKRAARGQSGKNAFTAPHIWWGRLWITIGIITGGMGLNLSGHSTGVVIAYAIAAGIVWLLWVASVVWSRKKKAANVESGSDDTGRPSRRSNFRLNDIGDSNFSRD